MTLSVSESAIKLGHLFISLANLLLLFLFSDNAHLKIWMIAQCTAHFLVTLILFFLANRNDFKRRWFYPPSSTKPGTIAHLHKWMNIVFFSIMVITVLVAVWGIFPLFLLHLDLAKIYYWTIVGLYGLSAIILIVTIKISLQIIKSSMYCLFKHSELSNLSVKCNHEFVNVMRVKHFAVTPRPGNSKIRS